MIQSIIQDKSAIIKEIVIAWHIEDVKSVRPDLSDEQASIILQHLKKNHDANIGINWETIDCIADILYPMNNEKN